jgi:NO-binding membrane sensor protein with MHYT domain
LQRVSSHRGALGANGCGSPSAVFWQTAFFGSQLLGASLATLMHLLGMDAALVQAKAVAMPSARRE